LLGGLGILVAVVLILVLSGGGSRHDNSSVGGRTSGQTGTSTTPAGQPQIIAQINLVAPRGGGHALGVANVLAQGGQRALALQAQGLAASTRSAFYAVWLYNSASDAQRLGFAPPVGKDGRLQAVSGLPDGASRFHQLIVTRESQRQPRRPGRILLRGKLSLTSA
jgi:hypothetical protein